MDSTSVTFCSEPRGEAAGCAVPPGVGRVPGACLRWDWRGDRPHAIFHRKDLDVSKRRPDSDEASR